jgi:hypothetical protein
MTTATAYADEIRRLSIKGIDASDITEATGASADAVRAWARADDPPTGDCRDRFLEFVSVIERLGRVMDQGYMPLWLHKPVVGLEDERPVEALRQGRYRDVCRLIAELEADSSPECPNDGGRSTLPV